MSDLEVRPGPGVDVVVIAPTGTTLGSKVTYNATRTRVRVKNTGTAPVPEPTPPPPPEPTPDPTPELPTIAGFGRRALEDLGTRIVEADSAAQWLDGWSRLGTTVDILRVAKGIDHLDVDLGAQVRRIDDRSRFLVDGRRLTVHNGTLWAERGSHQTFWHVRNRGGWAAGQSADGITVAGIGAHVAYVNCSASGHSDEGISTTRGKTDVTYQDCLIGKGLDPVHNYGSLNDIDRVSFIRPVFISIWYRQPQQYGPGLMDITNAIVVGNTADPKRYGHSLFHGARVNSWNPYFQDILSPVTMDTGSDPAKPRAWLFHRGAVLVRSGGMPASIAADHPIPAEAYVRPLTVPEAIAHAKAYAGALPHDPFDTALLARITA